MYNLTVTFALHLLELNALSLFCTLSVSNTVSHPVAVDDNTSSDGVDLLNHNGKRRRLNDSSFVNGVVKSSRLQPKMPHDQQWLAMMDLKTGLLIHGRALPFNFMESAQFKEWAEALCPEYPLPSRKRMGGAILQMVSDHLSSKVDQVFGYKCW